MLGEGGDEEEFVRGVLKPNVTPIFLEKTDSPTIVKQRFVEKYLSQKMFEVYRMNDDAARRAGGRRPVRPAASDAAELRPGRSSPTTATGCSSANAIDVLCRHVAVPGRQHAVERRATTAST